MEVKEDPATVTCLRKAYKRVLANYSSGHLGF